MLKRRRFLQYSSLAVASTLVAACGNQSPSSTENGSASKKLEKVTYGTNWYAQAEHGGFYQAVATGIYQEYGLDVTIKMGGPQVNGTQLLMSEGVDFFMGFGADAIRAVAEDIPKITVAAMFQKDPQVIIAHPDTGVKTLEDLQGQPIYISAAANTTFWPFLKEKFGFTDEQKRPYNFTVGPFLANENAAQQGYLSSEPLKIRKEGGFEPLVFLLADYGYDPYATTIETRKALVEENPDLVQRFVDASIKGWYSYLESPEAGNALIKEANPEMTDEQLEYGLAQMKEHGIVISGDAEDQGIGMMTQERWQSFFEIMADAGVFEPEIDYTQAFTLDFIGQSLE
ncbi:ABC transporter substrate-binding protein [Spirulina sp. CS-785/01]|uniref:ABC transporter substrate-binding protein n=1 Tax=Spirulina sp. CS-785/01 TaxID=3021716 RepID=UPI00232CD363|nr:ABC transporter substrate-binding protein [Spirulina sp. CS-785/01]MDB9312919.1 ABC transporter substrate-binding protein [Spirulina sp. CS-785/01]